MDANCKIDLSILIPTHNRAERLRQTLKSLAEVLVPPDRQMEVVVVANACTDQTLQVCQTVAAMPLAFRYVDEPQPGLSNARNRAIAEAGGEILAFLDDDVAVEKGWLAGLLDVFDHYPADIVAGRVMLWWEAVDKPAWLTHRSAHLLSCVEYGDNVCELFTAGEAIAANLAVRRCVLANVPGFRIDLGRQGRQVLAGDDTYFVAQALKAGHRMFYAPHARVQHWVSPERITLPYLSQAAFANGLARVQMIDHLTIARRIKLGAENGVKHLFYMVMEAFAAILKHQKGRINQRIRRMTCQGILTALLLHQD